jgi:hypothetical protein
MSRLEERGSGAWLSPERITRIRKASAIEQRRAEILELIARLQEHADDDTSGDLHAVAANRAHATNGVHARVSTNAARDGASIASEARAAVTALVTLRDLERRVRQLEEHRAPSTRQSIRPGTSVPPRGSIPPRGSLRPGSLRPEPDQKPGTVISGLIQGQLLSDVLQMVSSNSMTGVFTVECRRAKTVLHFDEGKIVHATGQGLEGEQAFFSIFGFDGGRYYFEETSEPFAQRTINSNTQFLILEALRQIDESRAE